MWVVAGLGNPGAQHRDTRHNLGFRTLDRLAGRWGVTFGRETHQALLAPADRADGRVILAKPQTWMNASGSAVASVLRWHRVSPAALVVIYDDVDLAPGRVRLRTGGGAGGHRGVASIIDHLGTDAFHRLRVGIGRPPTGCDTAEFVLAPPSAEERPVLDAAEVRAAEAVELVLTAGPARAMNRINQREAPHGGSPL